VNGHGHSPVGSNIPVKTVRQLCPGAETGSASSYEQPLAILVAEWLPTLQTLREPEMGANVFSRPQTQRDVFRMFMQVMGSQFDSVRG
jgi:hypothetical protein